MLIVSTRAERFNLKHDILALDENTARRIYEDILRIFVDSLGGKKRIIRILLYNRCWRWMRKCDAGKQVNDVNFGSSYKSQVLIRKT